MNEPARRGWRERVESGLYRKHRLACASTRDRRPGRRCACPYEIVVPGCRVGTTRIATVSATVSEARAERRRLQAAGRPREAGGAASGTLEELTAAYFRARAPVLAASTVKARDEAYRMRIGPRMGQLPLGEITRERVEVWLAELIEGSSRHAVWKSVSALRAIMKAGVEWGHLAENPAAGLRLPKGAPGEARPAERVLTEQQLRALFAGTGNARIETLLRAAGEGALRAGEVIGLRWPDVDLANRRIAVERSIWQEAGADGGPPRRIVRPPKGNRPRRVAITAGLAGRLSDWYAESVIGGGAPAGGHVWPGRSEGPMDASSPGQALGRVCDRVGLVHNPRPRRPGQRPLPLISFHGLRHTAASIMLGRGVPLIVVSRQLGHANPNITAEVYAHLLEDAQLDDAAAAFEGAFDAQTLDRTLDGAGDATESGMANGVQESGPAVF